MRFAGIGPEGQRRLSDAKVLLCGCGALGTVLADTLELRPSTHTPSGRARQSVTIRPTMRSYTVGNIDAAEQGVYTSFVTRYPRATLRLDVTPLTFRGDTSGTANRPQVSFGGLSPVSGRLDLRVRVGWSGRHRSARAPTTGWAP